MFKSVALRVSGFAVRSKWHCPVRLTSKRYLCFQTPLRHRRPRKRLPMCASRERWKNAQSAAAISRALERKNKIGVERIVVLHGGIGPAPRRRALAALRFEEREEISRGIAVGRSIRQIAQGLGRAPPG